MIDIRWVENRKTKKSSLNVVPRVSYNDYPAGTATVELIGVTKKTPDNAPTMPAMVGMVALDTPEAMDRAFPDPENAITSNTSIIPVTVPINPSKGQRATIVFMIIRY